MRRRVFKISFLTNDSSKMAGKFKTIPLDVVSLGLTVVALIFHNIGFFVGPWWKHEGPVGNSHFGMLTLKICQFSCVDKNVLALEGGKGNTLPIISCSNYSIYIIIQ